MDRLWTALVLLAVLGLGGAAARDKTNMPQAKQEEGQSNNATAMGKVVPDPSAGGRVDPEVLAGMYNRSGPIAGDMPSISLDGAMIANLTAKANISAEASTNWTDATRQKLIESSAGNPPAHLNESDHAQVGAMPNMTGNATAELDDGARAQMGAMPTVDGNATTKFDGVTGAQLGARPNATNATIESVISIDIDSGYQVNGHLHKTSGNPVWHQGNVTRAWIGPKPNATNSAKGTVLAGSSANVTLGERGSFSNASADAPVVLLDGAARGEMGPSNASVGTPTADTDHPAYSRTWNGTLATGERADSKGEPLGKEYLVVYNQSLPNETYTGPVGVLTTDADDPAYSRTWNGTLVTGEGADSKGKPLGKEHLAAYNQSLPNETYTGPVGAKGSLERPVKKGDVFFDVEVAAQRYRLAPGEEPHASANRSNDPDVVAMKEIASVVLDGREETTVFMTEVVIRSVLPDAENGTMMRDTELHEAIQGKFQDEDLMKRIVEGDANQTHARPEQGPCETCPQPISTICSLCWPVDFCRPFASKVDIPCPVAEF